MKPFSFFLHVFVCFFCSSTFVFAQSIGVSPDNIIFNITNNSIHKQQVLLFNTNPYPVFYDLTFENFSDIFSYDAKGVIDSFQSKRIILTLDSSKLVETYYNTNFLLSFKNPEKGFFVTGVKVGISVYNNRADNIYDFSSWFEDANKAVLSLDNSKNFDFNIKDYFFPLNLFVVLLIAFFLLVCITIFLFIILVKRNRKKVVV